MKKRFSPKLCVFYELVSDVFSKHMQSRKSDCKKSLHADRIKWRLKWRHLNVYRFLTDMTTKNEDCNEQTNVYRI